MPNPIDISKIVTRNLTQGVVRIQQHQDDASYIEIDPDTSTPGVFAYGNSRPLKNISIGSTTNYGTPTAATIGSMIQALRITATQDAGFFTDPIVVPDDLDTTMPIKVYFVIDSLDTASAWSGGVFCDASLTQVNLDRTIDEHVAQYKFNAVNWIGPDPYTILIDQGEGWTFDVNTLKVGSSFALRCALLRSNASDTFPASTKLSKHCILGYTRKSW